MRKIKLFLIVILGLAFLASCEMNHTPVERPINDEIAEGEEGYTITFIDYASSEEIIKVTKLLRNAVNKRELGLEQIVGYDITFVDEFDNEVDLATIREDFTVYVKYEPKSYCLNFYRGALLLDSYTIKYGDEIHLSDVTLTSTGYRFIGWSTNKEEFEEVDPHTLMPAENMGLYAFYEKDVFTLTLYTGLEELEGINNQVEYEYNARLGDFVPAELAEAIDGLENYTFVGWYTSLEYDQVFNLFQMPPADTTIYAKFEYQE